jgi:hypothetical protein
LVVLKLVLSLLGSMKGLAGFSGAAEVVQKAVAGGVEHAELHLPALRCRSTGSRKRSAWPRTSPSREAPRG